MNFLLRSCSRCGAEFETERSTICDGCRKIRGTLSRRESFGKPLTSREKQIVAHVMAAEPNKIIAADLHLAEGTVKEYLFHIYSKLGVKNRTELAVYAIQNPELISGKIDL